MDRIVMTVEVVLYTGVIGTRGSVMTGQSMLTKLHLDLGDHYYLIGEASVRCVYCQGFNP